jgi:diaminopimelate decarboxylase
MKNLLSDPMRDFKTNLTDYFTGDQLDDRLANSANPAVSGEACWLSQAAARSLLQTYGSPLYVYDADRLTQTIAQISRSVPHPHTAFRFASVTNGNVALLQIFRNQGWGLHANTPGDIYLGLQAGFDPAQIVYSGSNLNRTEMHQVLEWGVTMLNLDSLAQIELLCQVYGEVDRSRSDLHIGLRLNLPELTGKSRIGLRPEEFPAAVAIAARSGLKITGLHFYRGTGTNATAAFTQVMDRVLAAARELPDCRYLDFGGGFGYPYRHGGAAFDWEVFGREIADRLHLSTPPLDLVIEPGRAAIAGCAVLLAQVVSVKWQGPTQVVGVDTTVANLSVPAVHGGYREIVALSPNHDSTIHPTMHPTMHPTNVCGNTTYSGDYLGQNCPLPALQIGDIIAILDVGAYGYAMSSHFLHRPRPAEVLLENGQPRLIRHREDYSVLLNHQVFDG